jgi:hypothetical protein
VANVRRRDKAWLDHIAHEQVAYPLGVFSVGFITLLRLGLLRVSEGDQAGFFVIYIYRDIRKPGGVPRIIPDDLFNRAQIRAKAGKAKMKSGKPDVEYMLTTKLFCGYCEAAMLGDSGTSHNKTKYTYYSCIARKRDKKCGKKSVQQAWIEDNVVALTRRKILQPEIIQKIIDSVMKIQKQDSKTSVLAALEGQFREADSGIKNRIPICIVLLIDF